MRKHNAWPYTDISDNNTEPTQVDSLRDQVPEIVLK